MARSNTAKKSKSKTKSRLSKSLSRSKKTKMPKRKAKKAAAKKTKKKAIKKVAKKASKKTSSKTVTKTNLKLQSVSQTPELEIPRVQVGDMAPNFSMTDQNGQTVSLADFRGKKVLLYFYPKDDTPGCTKEACSFRDNLSQFEAKDTVILGVSFDDADSHQKFIGKYGLNFSLLSDLDKEVAKAYGVYVQKNMYGNISWGIERSTFVIDREGKIAAAFRRVQVDGHTDQVLAALDSIA